MRVTVLHIGGRRFPRQLKQTVPSPRNLWMASFNIALSVGILVKLLT
jgi:hypothetical protein